MTSVDDIPRIGRDEAMDVAAHEYDRMVDVLRRLDADQWSRPTDCTEWDVRAMALHLLGAAAANASMREFAHQMRTGRKLFAQIGGDHWVDGLNEVQIRERSGVANDAIPGAYAAIAPKAVRGRRRLPPFVRALRVLDIGPPYPKRMPLGWLMDVVFTRDVWMHRVDIARATGLDLVLTAEHDGRIVADIVAEWATLYDDPFDLELTGPAGGRYRSRADGEHVVVDAVEFVRIISGRAAGRGVLANAMPL